MRFNALLDKYHRLLLILAGILVLGFLISETARILHHQTNADLGVFLEATQRLVDGRDIFEPGRNDRLYRYPPLLAVLCIPLLCLPIGVTVALWNFAKIICIGWIVTACYGLISGSRFRDLPLSRKWAFGFFPILCTVKFLTVEMGHGQVNTFELALTILALKLAESGTRSQIGGGVAFGVAVVIKVLTAPMLLLFVLERRVKVILGACLGVFLGLISPALVLGFDGNANTLYRWVSVYVFGQSTDAILPIEADFSIMGQLQRFFSPVVGFTYYGELRSLMITELAGSTLHAIDLFVRAALVLLVVVYWLRFGRNAPKALRFGTAALLFTVTPLLIPTTQKHYFVLLLPAYCYLIYLWICTQVVDQRTKYLIIASVILASLLTESTFYAAFGTFFENAGFFIWGTLALVAAIFAVARTAETHPVAEHPSVNVSA